jgi:hypothetical protein
VITLLSARDAYRHSGNNAALEQWPLSAVPWPTDNGRSYLTNQNPVKRSLGSIKALSVDQQAHQLFHLKGSMSGMLPCTHQQKQTWQNFICLIAHN